DQQRGTHPIAGEPGAAQGPRPLDPLGPAAEALGGAMTEVPKTRWELGAEQNSGSGGYGAHFSELIESGADIEGEARLADALLGRNARVLDAGAGIGRIGGALQARGHDVLAVEKDRELIALAARFYPDLPMVGSDILALSRDLLDEAGHSADFDLIVLVGNVIVLAAPETEQRMLATLRDLLAE